MQALFCKFVIYKELTCSLLMEATFGGMFEIKWKMSSVAFFIAQIIMFSTKYCISKALSFECSLKEGISVGTVLLGETLKNLLAHCSGTLNSSRWQGWPGAWWAHKELSNTPCSILLEFACELHPPLHWCHLASDWGAKSWLVVWHVSQAMLMPGVVGPTLLQLSPTGRQQPNQCHQESNLMSVLGHGNCPDFSQSVRGWLRANDLNTRVSACRLIPSRKGCCRSGWALVSQLEAPFQTSGFFCISAVRMAAACLSLAELLLLFEIVTDILWFHSAPHSLVAGEHHWARSVKFSISRQLTLLYLKRKSCDEE